jgi:hypothetical protein
MDLLPIPSEQSTRSRAADEKTLRPVPLLMPFTLNGAERAGVLCTNVRTDVCTNAAQMREGGTTEKTHVECFSGCLLICAF